MPWNEDDQDPYGFEVILFRVGKWSYSFAESLIFNKFATACLALGTIDADEVFTLVSKDNVSIDITDFYKLKKYVINYRDGSVSSSGFDIFIPVEFEYAWGVYTGELKVSVK